MSQVSTMIGRFTDHDDLIHALLAQEIVQGDRPIAEAIASKGELVDFQPGQTIISQGATDRDVFFILTGDVVTVINGMRTGHRHSGVTVGEMSAINASITRAATVEAGVETVALRLSHKGLEEIAATNPDLWRRLAIALAGRLEQRNKFILRANKRPRVFLISSSEAHDIAVAIRSGLEHEDADVIIWSDEPVFEAGCYALEALEAQVNLADFGVAIAQADDTVRSRKRQHLTARDNVIFELGFFMSRLGRNRAVLLAPSVKDMSLPSDFKGLTPIQYKIDETRDLSSALAPAIEKIAKLVKRRGVRTSMLEAK